MSEKGRSEGDNRLVIDLFEDFVRKWVRVLVIYSRNDTEFDDARHCGMRS